MSKDHLVVYDDAYVHRIGWFLAEEQEIGLRLGDYLGIPNEAEPTDQEDWENWIAHRIARDSVGVDQDTCYYWETKKDAQAVLREIKAQFKRGRTHLADWERQALAAGWKPPKK